MNYWKKKDENKAKAIAHTQDMAKRYRAEIRHSIEKAEVYDSTIKAPISPMVDTKPVIEIVQKDSVSAIFDHLEGRTAVLNFASYKNPGGMFIEGSSAQEESLCHESDLYNVLSNFDATYYEWNRNHKNRALYTDRALYLPDILFERNGVWLKCDVITCAAPNYKAASRYMDVSKEDNTRALRSRIHFVKAIAEENKVSTLILGAYGCGVFGQDTNEVAAMFKEAFTTTPIRRVIFAIPDQKNLIAFERIWKNR